MVAAEPRPTTAEQLDDALRPGQAGRRRLRQAVRRRAGHLQHRRHRARHGPAAPGARRRRSSPTSATPTARPSARPTPSSSRRRCARWCSTAPSTPTPTRRPTPRPAPRAWRRGFDAFAQNCTGLIAGCPLGADPRAVRRATCSPRPTRPRSPAAEPGETRKATAGIVLTAVQAALYDTGSWPQLAQALAAAQKGDAKGLFALADSYSGRLNNGTYSNLLDANMAISCADTEQTLRRRARSGPWPPSWTPEVPAVRRGLGDRPLHLLGVEGAPHAAAGARRRRAARRSWSSATPATR